MGIDSNLRRIILIVIGIGLSFLFVAMAIRRMEWQNVFEAMSNAQLYPWLFFSVLSYLIGQLVRGARTRLLVSHDAKLSVLTASNIVVVGYAANNILPARMGELARAGMLSERTGISFIQSLTVTFLERVLDGLVMLLLLAVATLFLNLEGWVHGTMFFASLIFSLASASVLFVVMAPNLLIALTSKVIYAINPRWHDVALRFVSSIANGVGYLRKPVNALIVFALSIVVWLFEAGLFLFLLPAFGLELNIWHALFVMTVTNLGILIPSSPGFIGSFHFFCMQGLVLLGVAEVTSLSFSMMVHLAFYVPVTLWGGAVILWYGFNLGLTVKLVQKAKPMARLLEQISVPANLLGFTLSEKRSKPASTLIYKLTESLLPIESLPLSHPQTVVSDVAVFVHEQLRSLPRKFQILFNIGMFGFVLFVWLRYFHSFSLLSLSKRVKIVNRWAYGKLSLTRQLFRGVRSTALLAFYEHPAVMEVLENQHLTPVSTIKK